MRLIEATGSAFEIGRSRGEQSSEHVRAAVALVCRFELPSKQVDLSLRRIEELLGSTFPHVLEEASGLAVGASISERDALALSVASDVHGRLPGWCSLVAVPSDEGVLAGKNLDTTNEMGALQLIEVLAPDRRHRFTHVTAAGAMWTDGGVNEAGLALVNASLAAAAPVASGVPDGILAREVLAGCGSVEAAIDFLAGHELLSLGENILLADRGGRIALVEKLPGGQVVHEGPRAVACNHVRAESLADLMLVPDPIRENSERRLARLIELTAERRNWSLADVQNLLASHEGGVCQHGDAGLWTVAGLVLAPRERRMWVNEGPPCHAAWDEAQAGIGRVPDRAHTTEEV